MTVKNSIRSLVCIVLLGLFSFVKPPKMNEEVKKIKKSLTDSYVYVPSGNVVLEKDTLRVADFLLFKTEASNFHYLEYLSDLKRNNKMEEYNKALPDTNLWVSKKAMNQKLVSYYFRHPAYRNYPVVNVSQEQAKGYCLWLQEIIRKKSGNNSIVVRLPYRNEFLRAANGNTLVRRFSWEGASLRNKDGMILCNHLNLSNINISKNEETGTYNVVTKIFETDGVTFDHADITAPVESYFKSDLGFYNLNGNVSEWVMEKDIAVGGDWSLPGYNVQNVSFKKCSTADPTIGFRVLVEIPRQN